jgi:hypothetical protein
MARLACRCFFPLQGALADYQCSNRKSGKRAALDGFGRRRIAFCLRAVFGANQQGQDYSVELFHGLGGLREPLQRHLRTVEELGTSFCFVNIQFYWKSIEYMQHVVGARPSKWRAGCHDRAVFFNGIREQVDTTEAQPGLGHFRNVTAAMGAAFNRPIVARAAAYADCGRDGDGPAGGRKE